MDEQDLDQAYAEGWRPEEGSVIVGTVTDLGRGWSDYKNDYYPIVTVMDDKTQTEVAIHCFQTVLERKMKELKPKVGEKIGVKFLGKHPTKNGKNEVANYTVKVEGRTVDPWEDFAPSPSSVQRQAEPVPGSPVGDDDDIPF